MAKEIQHGKLPLREVFKLWFRVPEYQRAYVWETDQVQELMQDTYDAFQQNKDAEYFLGSLVLKINPENQNGVPFNEYELLDGQQRLTTLFLMFAVFRDTAAQIDQNKYRQLIDACQKALFQEEDMYAGTPERMRIVYNIRGSVQEFVEKYIKQQGKISDKASAKELAELAGNKDENVSIRNMANAILVMNDFLDEHKSEIDLYFLYLYSKVLIIYVATEELQDAFQLFTVLNNRGVKLSNSDILKAENLRAVQSDSARETYAKKWEEMESYFGEDFDQFLSHIRTILVKKKAAYGLLKEFEENVYSSKTYDRTTKQYITHPPILTRGKETFDCIDEFYQIYGKLFDQDNYDVNKDYDIYNYIKLMSIGLGTDYWVAPLMDYYKKYKTEKLKEFIMAVDRKISTDWIIALTPTARIENLNAILQEIEKSASADEVLESVALKIDQAEFERILQGDLYGKRFARYLMLKLDLLYHGNTTKFDPPQTISIEHILPQNPGPDSRWVKDFTQQEREEWTDKIGNLTLLSRRKNASQGNQDFILKKAKYFHGNVELFSSSIQLYNNYAQWTPTELKKNNKSALEKLLNAYQC